LLPAMRNNCLTRRKRLGLTREALAALADVSISTIVRAENHKPLHPFMFRAIEAALAIKEAESKVEAL